jgi:endonuclease/exonuclease/phosphatase family metal-dependent hydrolase
VIAVESSRRERQSVSQHHQSHVSSQILGLRHRSDHMPFLVASALSTTMMLEATRIFFSHMVFVLGQAERVWLATIASVSFLAFGLSGRIVRRTGAGRAILLAGFALAVARLIIQFWDDPYVRLILGAFAVVCWGWLLPVLLSIGRETAATGVGIGLVLDLAIRTFYFTVDLPWMPDLAMHIVTILVAVALCASVAQCAELSTAVACSEPGFVDCIPLLGVGSGLALYHLLTGNLGLAQVRLDTTIGPTAGLLGLGLVIGLTIGALLYSRPLALLESPGAMPQWTLLAAIIGGLGLWLVWSGGESAQVGAELGGAGSTLLLFTCLLTVCRGPREPGLRGITFWFTAGMLVQAIFLFGYFALTGSGEFVTASFLVLAGSALFGAWRQRLRLTIHLAWVARPLAVAFLLLVAATAWQAIDWDSPEPGSPLPTDFTVMTYNIQSGYDLNDNWSLEGTADTIEAAQPDVVILQEVSRGWPITSGIEEALWLSHRLDMPIYFGAASVDGMWGNAILTKAPVSSVAVRRYSETEDLQRSVIEVRLETVAGPVSVFATHLDSPRDADEIRMAQTEELLGFIDGKQPAILGADLNSVPGSEVVTAIEAAGLQNAGPIEGSTFPDGRRFDYIMVSSEFVVRDAYISDSTASDHKAVVAEVTLAPS